MSWESLDWQSPDATEAIALAEVERMAPLLVAAFRGALARATAGRVIADEVRIATALGSELPAEFSPLATFGLLGGPRRTMLVAADPSAPAVDAVAGVNTRTLAQNVLIAFDADLRKLSGDGIKPDAPGSAPVPNGRLILLRFALRSADGYAAAVAVAMDADVVAELATHVVALHALGNDFQLPDAPVASASSAAPGARTPARPAATDGPTLRGGTKSAEVSVASFEEIVPSAPSSRRLNGIDLLLGVNLQVSVEIGRTRLPIRDVLALTAGSVVQLDKLAGEKVDVLVNGHTIATGEVVIVDDNFGVRIAEVASGQRRMAAAEQRA
jgi:flagellar motor switch protein FliN